MDIFHLIYLIGALLLSACAGRLYWICRQLFKRCDLLSLREREAVEQTKQLLEGLTDAGYRIHELSEQNERLLEERADKIKELDAMVDTQCELRQRLAEAGC